MRKIDWKILHVFVKVCRYSNGAFGLNLTKTPYLVLFILLGAVGVGAASALMTITLAGNVVITDDLTVDSSTLVVDSANDKVGMGTTNPGRLLTVIDGTPNTAQLRLGQTDSRFWDLWGGFDLHFQKNGITRMFLKDNGNVGIGTTNPSSKLHVVGDLTLQSNIICTDCIDAADIAPNAVGSSEIAAGAVGFSEIAAGAVGSSEIVAGAVGSSEIADESITSFDIADNAIFSSHIAANSVGQSEIDLTIITFDASGGTDTTMIPVDGKSFCALLKARALDSSSAECDIDFGGLSDWVLQSNTAGAVCQAICIQFG